MVGMNSPWNCPHGRPTTVVSKQRSFIKFKNARNQFNTSIDGNDAEEFD